MKKLWDIKYGKYILTMKKEDVYYILSLSYKENDGEVIIKTRSHNTAMTYVNDILLGLYTE